MTRINGNIKPAHLLDKHLFAEYREIIRIPNAVYKNLEKNSTRKLTESFTLGNGHVLYYYKRLKFLHKRFLSILDELKFRGYNNLSIDDEAFLRIKNSVYRVFFYHDITDENELKKTNEILVERILDRAGTMKKLTINGIELTFEDYTKLLTENYL